jgi:hypothetical protein
MCRRLYHPSRNNQLFLRDNCGNNSKNKKYGVNSNSSRRRNGNKTYGGSSRMYRLLKPPSISNPQFLPHQYGSSKSKS